MTTTLIAGQSATVTLNAGDKWSISKSALSEGTFSAVDANGIVVDGGVFGNTTLTNKIYGPYNNAVNLIAAILTISCKIGSIAYTYIPAEIIFTNFPVSSYGAKGDGIKLSDVTTTNGSPVISSASYSFTALDVGKYITIAGAAAAAAVLNSTIISVSGGKATLNNNAGTSKAGNAVATFGTDDSAAFNAAVTAANTAGGGVVSMGKAIYVIASTITWKSLVSLNGQGWGKSILKWISTSSMTSAVIQAITGTKDIQYIDCQFTNFEIDGAAATQASYNVAGKGIYIQYMLRPLFQNLYVHDTPATGLGMDHLQYGNIIGNIVSNCGRLNSGSGLGGAGIGIAMGGSFPSATYPESVNIVDNIVLDNKRYGIFLEGVGTTTPINSFAVVTGNYIHMSATSGHGIGDSGMQNMNISGNVIVGVSGSLDGISVDVGTLTVAAGVKGLISNNVITTARNGIQLNYTSNPAVSLITEYAIKGNKIEASIASGILITTEAATLLDILDISNNQCVRNGVHGISIAGTGSIKGLSIKGNKCINNTGNGFKAICAIADLTMVANDFLDEQAVPTQVNGIEFNGAVAITDAFITDNKLTGNTGAGYTLTGGATLAGRVINNPGYNPVGTSSVSPGASPWTYTAGVSPEVVYISAGTVTSVEKNGNNIGLIAGSFPLNPNDTLVVTYAVAPTVWKDVA